MISYQYNKKYFIESNTPELYRCLGYMIKEECNNFHHLTENQKMINTKDNQILRKRKKHLLRRMWWLSNQKRLILNELRKRKEWE